MKCSLCQVAEVLEVVKTDDENLYLCEDCSIDYKNGAEWIGNLE